MHVFGEINMNHGGRVFLSHNSAGYPGTWISSSLSLQSRSHTGIMWKTKMLVRNPPWYRYFRSPNLYRMFASSSIVSLRFTQVPVGQEFAGHAKAVTRGTEWRASVNKLRACRCCRWVVGELSRMARDTLGQTPSGWWFGTFFIFPYIDDNNPNWLINSNEYVSHGSNHQPADYVPLALSCIHPWKQKGPGRWFATSNK